MTKTNKNEILIAGACIFRENAGKVQWLLVKEVDSDKWELAKTMVRKGESSVRAILRVMGEKGGMSTRVLEEAGRAGGVGISGGKTLPQRVIYYLMIAKKMTGEAIGFSDHTWLDFSQVTRKVFSKREKVIMRDAKEEFKRWHKKRAARRKLKLLLEKKSS